MQMKFYPASVINDVTSLGLCTTNCHGKLWFKFTIFLSDVDVDHSSCTAEHGEDNTGCERCQHLRQTSVEKLTHDKETTDQGQTVTSTRSTGHASPFSEIDQPSVEPARITSCGKNKHQEQVRL